MEELLQKSLEELKTKKYNLNLIRIISTGKEATVYLVRENNEKLYALKVYKDYETRAFKRNQEYIAGKYIHKKSEQKAIRKNNSFGKKLSHTVWIKREYFLLRRLYELNIKIPKPIVQVSNAILMEYLGDYNNPAPKLKDVVLQKSEAKKIYTIIENNIDTMYKNGIVHGDLSPYNILYWKNVPYIIDFPQALDIRNNPNVITILERDKMNMLKWVNSVK